MEIESLDSVGPVEVPYFPPLEPIAPLLPSYGKSTLAAAPKIEVFSHFMPSLIASHHKLEELTQQQAALLETEFDEGEKEIQELEQKNQDTLRKHAQAVAAKNTWGALSSAAQYILSGVGLFFGAALCQSAPVTGGLLLTSGALGLSAQILHDTGATRSFLSWVMESEEEREKWASRIESGMLLISAGLGMAAGVSAYKAGLLFAAQTFQSATTRIGAGIGIAATIGKGVFEMGMAYEEKKKAHLEADLQITATDTDLIKQGLTSSGKGAQSLVETTGDIGKQIQGILAQTQVHID